MRIHHLSVSIPSTFTELRLRYSLRMIAKASASSAAAMVMTNTMSHLSKRALRLSEVDERREPDQVDVDRVQHQLDGHQDHDRTSPGEYAVKSSGKERRGEHLNVGQLDQSRSPLARTSTIDPISATSSTKDATSNGIAHVVNRLSPIVSSPNALAVDRPDIGRHDARG